MGRRLVPSSRLALSLAACIAAATAAAATEPSTSRVSVDSFGRQADGLSDAPSISATGRFVAFASVAKNLVDRDTNGVSDVFLHDRRTRRTTRVSVASNGAQADGPSTAPAISADGRYVSFESPASNLVTGDTNGFYDVFVHDTRTGETVRASVSSSGAQANGQCRRPALSGDGRFVAFDCNASTLVDADTNALTDVFVRDQRERRTTRISVGPGGAQANGESFDAAISGDGAVIAFSSGASNLVAADGNNAIDVFVRDVRTQETTRASISSTGGETNAGAPSLLPAVSANGRVVAFESDADNLVAGDTNSSRDVFLRDLASGQTVRASVDAEGRQLEGVTSTGASLGADGFVVAFDALVLVAATHFTIVKSLRTGAVMRATVDPNGLAPLDYLGPPTDPALSGSGRLVAFAFRSGALVAGDSNGVADVFVRDAGGNSSPSASFSLTTGTGEEWSTVKVDASSSDDVDGWVESYAWTFGDGGTATGVAGPHAYGRAGTFTITLTVTDNDGATSTVSKAVTLQAAPAPLCTITGTPGPDVLRGTPRADRICGLGGDDRIDGRGGNDRIVGGDGNDVLTGGFGRDTLVGGPGRDRLLARDGIADVVDGGSGRDTATVDRGRDRVRNVEAFA